MDDLVDLKLLFDTSSVKDRRIELPAELYPLAKQIVVRYESLTSGKV